MGKRWRDDECLFSVRIWVLGTSDVCGGEQKERGKKEDLLVILPHCLLRSLLTDSISK